jgi:hypothetical protein
MSETRASASRGSSPRADRKAVFLSAVLVLSSFIAYAIATAYHPGGVDANNHPAVFAQYANSSGWTADHLGWFVESALLIAGLLVLFNALRVSDGIAGIAVRIGVVSASVALALSAVRYAVDGVVLKRAVDAWFIAPDAEKAARFASAEIARWMEEASISYQSFVLGLSLLLLAAVIVWSARVPRPIGFLLALGGAAYLVFGWIVGESGLAPEGAMPNYIAAFSPLFAGVWLLITGWRMPRPASQSTANDYPAELAGEGGI